MNEMMPFEGREWVCDNGHIQMFPAVVTVEGAKPWCVVCFSEWAARKFPTRERPRP